MKADPPPTQEQADVPSPGDLDPPPCRTLIRAILGAVDVHDKKRVLVGGYVRTGCKPSSLLALLELNDGSCQQNLQAVVKAQVYDELQRLTPTGTSVLLEGVLDKLDGAKHRQLIELKVERVIEVGDVDDEGGEDDRGRLTLDGLADLVHLRPREDKLPWIVSWDGGLITPPDDHVEYQASIPDNALCLGSTNDWLLLGIGELNCYDNYVLHNPFTLEYVPLPELDTVLHRGYNIRKFVMRSTIHDFIAIVTTNENTPLVVILPGKGVWLPEPRAAPYIYIIDISFLEDKLYAITMAENLIPFDLGLNEDGSPMVTIGRRVIRQPLDYEGYEWWPESDDDYSDLYDGDDDNSDLDDDDDDAADDDDNDEGEEETVTVALDVVVDDYEKDREAVTYDDDGWKNINYLSCSLDYTSDDEITTWHLVKSLGKLLLVKPRMHIPSDFFMPSIRQVEVFQADIDKGEWVLMANGLGGGQALFIDRGFSKSVSAPFGDVEEGDIYFIESGEVFNIKTQRSNLKRFRKPFYYCTCGMWLFSPDLVL